MKLLITNGYLYKLDAKQWKMQEPYPPMGTLLTAAVARRELHAVNFFDMSLADGPDALIPAIEESQPDYLVIWDDGFNYLTKMCLTTMREAVFRMTEIALQKNVPVIVCSSDSSDHFDKYFQHGVSLVIRGEGEITLMDVLKAIAEKQPWDTIPGIAFQHNGQTTTTPVRQVMKDLDELPFPAWDLIDLTPYREIWKKRHGYFSLNMATTRGCPYKCNWCAKPIYGNRYHSRSVTHVVDEIQNLLETQKPDHFWMCDDIFGLKPGWVQQFAQEVERRNLRFKYKIQSRVDLLLQADAIEALARSGADTVWVGAESGSQAILDAMDKGTTIEQIHQASQLLHQKGIKVAFFIQFGYPGETREDIDRTINMVLSLMPDEIGISVSYPLPGTKFFEKVKADFQGKENWSDSDDLALMFRSTYHPGYYKILHRYLHARYRVQRGIKYASRWFASPFRPDWQSFRTMASMAYHAPITIVRQLQLKHWN